MGGGEEGPGGRFPSRSELAARLKERGLRPRRSLGQNFLVDPNFLDAIARDADVGPGDGIIEIGAGPGGLTDRLAASADRVWAFEIDPAILGLARELLSSRPNVTLVEADGADFERHVDPSAVTRLKVVANLPYGPWRRLLLRLLSTRLAVESYTLMLQRDVVDRLRAAPGTRAYGPMSAIVQATCDVRLLRRAGRGLFLPAPRIESAVVQLRRTVAPRDLEPVEARLEALFAGRRKKSKAAGGRRIETLEAKELFALAEGPGIP